MTIARSIPAPRRFAVIGAGLVAGSALLFLGGAQARPAAADVSLVAPHVISAKIVGTDYSVTFQDNADEEGGFDVFVSQDAGATITPEFSVQVTPVPGVGRVATRTFTGPAVTERQCFEMDAWGGFFDSSDRSNQVCFDPAAAAKQPDVSIDRIGNENALRPNSPAALVIILKNYGPADANGSVSFTVASSGSVTLTKVLLDPSTGFTCSPITMADRNAAFRCSGGTLKSGQDLDPGIMVNTGASGQFGIVDVQVSLNGQTDSDTSNNYLSRRVTMS